MYVDDLDSPVSFWLQHVYGSVGALFLLENFRNKSLGIFVVAEMSKAVAARGFTVYTVVRSASRKYYVGKMAAKIGGLESKYTINYSYCLCMLFISLSVLFGC